MNRTACLWCGLCGLLLTGCISGKEPSNFAQSFQQTGWEPAPKTAWASTEQPSRWPVFGDPGPGKIRVTVSGEVRRAGIFYLNDGALISHALEAAGTNEFSGSTLTWSRTAQANEAIEILEKDIKKPLKDGDSLLVSRE